jgi:hypothetical protein
VFLIAIAGLTFATVIMIRIRLLGIPLERDEGEYAYMGQLMLQGIPPYKLAYSMKFPGTAAAYAVTMAIFGQTIIGIHLGLLLIIAGTAILIFLLGRRLANPTVGTAAAASYAVLSATPGMLGLASHATHFVMLPVLAGLLTVVEVSNRRAFGRIFASGLLLGLGPLMKQPAIFFVLFGGIYLLVRDFRDRLGRKEIFLRSLTFCGGALLPFGITCLVLWSAGVFDKFWFWTVDYARQYAGEISLSTATKDLIPCVTGSIGSSWPLWVLAGLGLLVGLCRRQSRSRTSFLCGLLLFSVLALSPRLYLRNHYFILLLPALSLLTGVAVNELNGLAAGYPLVVRFLPVLLLSATLGWPIYQARKVFFYLSPVEACQTIYSGNPFVESVTVAQYIRDRTSPGDQIAVLGSEPQIYFYAHRHSATGYIYTYEMVEQQKYAAQMQQEMISEIEAAMPKYLVVVGIGSSWLSQPGSQHPIFNWITDYTRQNYTLVGLVNMVRPERTDYYFDKLPKMMPPFQSVIFVDRRNP